MAEAGAITGVVWSNEDADLILKKNFPKFLDRPLPTAYLGITSGAQSDRRRKREGANKMTNRKVATKTRKAAPVEEVDDDLDDLEDLDDFEDDLEDEDEEDEEDEDEDEEEETPRARNVRKQTAAKAATKPGKVTVKVPAAKSKNGATATKARGNAGNLTPRRVTEGMKGAADLATAVGADARSVRIVLRKLKTEKSENGLYEWKPGKVFDGLVKSVKKEIAAKNA